MSFREHAFKKLNLQELGLKEGIDVLPFEYEDLADEFLERRNAIRVLEPEMDFGLANQAFFRAWYSCDKAQFDKAKKKVQELERELEVLQDQAEELMQFNDAYKKYKKDIDKVLNKKYWDDIFKRDKEYLRLGDLYFKNIHTLKGHVKPDFNYEDTEIEVYDREGKIVDDGMIDDSVYKDELSKKHEVNKDNIAVFHTSDRDAKDMFKKLIYVRVLN